MQLLAAKRPTLPLSRSLGRTRSFCQARREQRERQSREHSAERFKELYWSLSQLREARFIPESVLREAHDYMLTTFSWIPGPVGVGAGHETK